MGDKMNKNIFRQTQIKRLNQIDITSKRAKEALILESFFDQHEVKNARKLAITMSHGFELDTAPIIQRLIENGKCVYVPRTLPERQMEFVEYNLNTPMQPKFQGILEPVGGNVARPEALDLIIVPGLAYEVSNGYRLGFGGGYYDRYLKKTPASKIVLAFSEQIYSDPQWDVEPFDVPLEKIITEEGVQFER